MAAYRGFGVLVHALYLGGVSSRQAHGLPAGVTALVVGMQLAADRLAPAGCSAKRSAAGSGRTGARLLSASVWRFPEIGDGGARRC